jgi:hypothetical protein
MMASEFAQTAAEKAFKFQGYRFNETETAGIAKQLDAELQEVRDTLHWLLESKGAYLFHEDECPWQYGPDDCTCRVSRARQLAERLRVDDAARRTIDLYATES